MMMELMRVTIMSNDPSNLSNKRYCVECGKFLPLREVYDKPNDDGVKKVGYGLELKGWFCSEKCALKYAHAMADAIE